MKRLAPITAVLVVALVGQAALLGAAPAAAETREVLWKSCPSGSDAGECLIPRGIAADPDTGHLFVADQSNSRVVEFTAWGEFVKAWGWGVRDGAAELQTCGPGASPPSTDCQAGLRGSAPGQFDRGVEGVAVDSGGNVFVVDRNNFRVQKFSPEGDFLLMFGGGVNQGPTHPGDVCTAQHLAEGDVCGAGSSGTASGEFSADWPISSYLAVGPADQVYVGDEDRIQRFNTSGEYVSQISLPEPGVVRSLAVDPNSGALFFSYQSGVVLFPVPTAEQPNVYKLDPATGTVLDTLEVKIPLAIAVGEDGRTRVTEDQGGGSGPTDHPTRILEFDADGKQIGVFGEGDFPTSSGPPTGAGSTTGIATNVVTKTGETAIYVTSADEKNSFVLAYYPPPDKWPAPVAPPTIASSYATSVGIESATVQTEINPHFWADTTYQVEYGTEDCAGGGCTALSPRALGGGVVEAVVKGKGVLIVGLQPNTTYHYRFVAQSGGGGPVFGPDRTFTTSTAPGADNSACPNQAFRTGPGASLPDCRAYEMVSPVDKNNGDIGAEAENLSQATADGSKLTYSSYIAFGGALSAPYASQYIAARSASGWGTEAVNPPQEGRSFAGLGGLLNPFRAFSADLCNAWFVQEFQPVLAPGAAEGYFNTYRRDNCAGGAYEALTTVAPANHKPFAFGESEYFAGVQGVTADGTHAVLRANGKLTADASDVEKFQSKPIIQVYESDGAGGLVLVSVMPDGRAASEDSSLGSAEERLLPNSRFFDNVHNALSADGSMAYWTTLRPNGLGAIYLRRNPLQPQSAFALGSASGTGSFGAGSKNVAGLVAAAGTGTLTSGSSEVTALKTTTGRFVPGQPIAGTGIPAGTTVLAATETTLTLSAAATASASGVALSSKGPLPFAVGQTITGAGIPTGTTIAAVGSGTLTLSAATTAKGVNVPLTAYSECSEPEKACTLEVAPVGARFWTASPSGSKAVYGVSEGVSGGEALYEFDAGSEQSSPIADEVLGLAGWSEDANRLYLASREALSGSQANSHGDVAQAGEPNLYLYEAGGSPAFTFIGTLASEDFPGGETSPVADQPVARLARVTADGSHIAFLSAASLTGRENIAEASDTPVAQVFLYDAESQKLSCVSCNRTGARPEKVRNIGQLGNYLAAAQLPEGSDQFHFNRALSEDGSRVFFESSEALVPRDTNGKVDVYEWEEPGAGDCTEADRTYSDITGGCVRLISTGQSPTDSRFLDASAEGSDVFFLTAQSLVAQDKGLIDVYDARIGGGFPPPPAPPAVCEGEACQGTPAAPNDPTPASSGFRGAGNVKEGTAKPRCAKGKARKKGRCVKKKAKKKGKAKRASHERRSGR